MNIAQAIVLGIVQGATEFLPVSSSGHLIIIPAIFGIKEQPLVFDTIIHLATALTLVVVFFPDYLNLFRDFLKEPFKLSDKNGAGLLLVLLACIPAGVIGFLFDSLIETKFRDASYVILFMAAGTILMYLAERYGKRYKNVVNTKTGIFVGFIQSLALLPGVSRSGATISGGMLFGLSRETAARFSFLISVPIICAAALFKIISTDWTESTIGILPLVFGFIASFITGLLAVRFLLKYLKKSSLYVFIFYRVFVIMVVALAFI